MLKLCGREVKVSKILQNHIFNFLNETNTLCNNTKKMDSADKWFAFENKIVVWIDEITKNA